MRISADRTYENLKIYWLFHNRQGCTLTTIGIPVDRISRRRLSMKRFQFLCPNCQYQFFSTADEDFFGYNSTSLIMICRVCSALVDVAVRAVSPGQEPFFRKCPRCASAKLSPWNPLDMPCPKCGASMSKSPAEGQQFTMMK